MLRLAALPLGFTLGSGLLAAPNVPAGAAETLPALQTNQGYAEEAMRATTLAVEDPMAVFAFVLGNLPDRVKVYPTENYYYFYFVHRHIRYAGNIRFDVTDRDQGKVHFAYYEDLTEWTYYDEAIKHVAECRMLALDTREECLEEIHSIANQLLALRDGEA